MLLAVTGIPLRPTVLEIDLDAAADNLRAVRRLVGAERKIFAVIKADGYGFGAAEMGSVFARNGADYLGVADLTEGVRLRRRGITTRPRARPRRPHRRFAIARAHTDRSDRSSRRSRRRRGRDHRPSGRPRDLAGRGRLAARPRAPPRRDDRRAPRRPCVLLARRGGPLVDSMCYM